YNNCHPSLLCRPCTQRFVSSEGTLSGWRDHFQCLTLQVGSSTAYSRANLPGLTQGYTKAVPNMSTPRLAVLLVLILPTVRALTEVPIDHYWDGVLQAYACVNITQPLSGWAAHLLFDADVTSIEVWDAVQNKLSARDYRLTSQHYNGQQQVGDTLCIYFRGHLAVKTDSGPSISVYIEGMDEPTAGPVTSGPESSTTAPPTTTIGAPVPGKRFTVEIESEWPGGFQGKACVTAYIHMDGWRARLKFKNPGVTQIESIWHATETRFSKRHYVLYNMPYNAVLEPGDRVCVGFVAKCRCLTAPAAKIFIEGNTRRRRTTKPPSTQSPTQAASTQPPTQPPTQAPSTQPPTQAASTQSPTQAASTQSPTQAPSTQSPTQAASTQSPTQAASTQSPTQAASTQSPTQAASTQSPTQPPSTQSPTQPPSTQSPTQPPTQPPSTQSPTQPPTQAASTQSPTQPPSTQSPTHAASTQSHTQSPTQVPSTQAPITSSPSPATETPVSVPVTNEWNGGFQAEPCVDIYTDLDGWTAQLQFGSDIDSIEVWVASPTRVTPRHFRLDDLHGDQLAAGDRLCFTFVARCSCTQAPDISIYINGNIGGSGGGGDNGDGGDGNGGNSGDDNGGGNGGNSGGGPANVTKDYSEALRLSILFYAAQRSGPLPEDNPIGWRGDSALTDCVTGGWYDAGDHVKFGLPMASSTTLLTWSLVQFKDGYQRAGQLDAMYDSVRWPLDYFLTAWDESASTLLVQVRLELTWLLHVQHKAHFFTCLTCFISSDQAYSDQLLGASRSLYDFAKNNRGLFGGAAPFYSSSGDADELCVAAMFLYKATGEADYLSDAHSFLNPGTPWALSWDNKFIACQILLYEETGQYKSNVQSFFQSWSQDGGMSYTPCGLAWRDNWGSTRYAGNAAFAALVAADVGIDSEANRKWAAEQVNYILGDNRVNGQCFSFLVGYGDSFPQQPHHRGASCPDLPLPCSWAQESATTPNPQVLHGALVGGPDSSGSYNDDRGDYIANEVATDYNSGFQGALAGQFMQDTCNTMCPSKH
ncbi:hypothetical protein EGW08_001187, partial [Elysia chlorotica]